MLDVNEIIARGKSDGFIRNDQQAYENGIGNLFSGNVSLEKAAELERNLKGKITGFKSLTDEEKEQRRELQRTAKANLKQGLYRMNAGLGTISDLRGIDRSLKSVFYGMGSTPEENQKKEEMLHTLKEGSEEARHELFLDMMYQMAQFPMEQYRRMSDEEKINNFPQYFPVLQMGMEGEEVLEQFMEMDCGITDQERTQFTILYTQLKSDATELVENLDIIVNPNYPYLDLGQVAVKDQGKLSDAMQECGIADNEYFGKLQTFSNARNVRKNNNAVSEIRKAFAAEGIRGSQANTLVSCDKNGKMLEADQRNTLDMQRLKAGETVYYYDLQDRNEPRKVMAFKDLTGDGTPTRVPPEVPQPNGLVRFFDRINRAFGGSGLRSVNQHNEYVAQINDLRTQAQSRNRADTFTQTADTVKNAIEQHRVERAAAREMQAEVRGPAVQPEPERQTESVGPEAARETEVRGPAVQPEPEQQEPEQEQEPEQQAPEQEQEPEQQAPEQEQEPQQQAPEQEPEQQAPEQQPEQQEPQPQPEQEQEVRGWQGIQGIDLSSWQRSIDTEATMADQIAQQWARGESLHLDQIVLYARKPEKIVEALDRAKEDIDNRKGDRTGYTREEREQIGRINNRRRSAESRMRDPRAANKTDEELIQEHMASEVARNVFYGKGLTDEYKEWCNKNAEYMANMLPLYKDSYERRYADHPDQEETKKGLDELDKAIKGYQTLAAEQNKARDREEAERNQGAVLFSQEEKVVQNNDTVAQNRPIEPAQASAPQEAPKPTQTKEEIERDRQKAFDYAVAMEKGGARSTEDDLWIHEHKGLVDSLQEEARQAVKRENEEIEAREKAAKEAKAKEESKIAKQAKEYATALSQGRLEMTPDKDAFIQSHPDAMISALQEVRKTFEGYINNPKYAKTAEKGIKNVDTNLKIVQDLKENQAKSAEINEDRRRENEEQQFVQEEVKHLVKKLANGQDLRVGDAEEEFYKSHLNEIRSGLEKARIDIMESREKENREATPEEEYKLRNIRMEIEDINKKLNPVTAAKEAPKPAQEESKPAQEEPKPVQEESKPVQEESKPVQEESKPVQEEPKPAKEESKPVQEESKPAKEESKPVQEAPKPVQEAPKPVQEAPKPVQEAPKPTVLQTYHDTGREK